MNDPLFGNKLAAALLTALLLFFGLPQLADRLVGGAHHAKAGEELHLAYPIDYEVTGGGGSDEPEISIWEYAANATPAVGQRRAMLCTSCHSFEQGGANGTGPNLWNIVGRPVASVSGFNYSSALKEFGGAWTYERLDEYLKNSQAYIPGTSMVQRFPKDEQRAQLLVYLGSLSANPQPLPEPPAPVIEELPEVEAPDPDDAATATAPDLEENPE